MEKRVSRGIEFNEEQQWNVQILYRSRSNQVRSSTTSVPSVHPGFFPHRLPYTPSFTRLCILDKSTLTSGLHSRHGKGRQIKLVKATFGNNTGSMFKSTRLLHHGRPQAHHERQTVHRQLTLLVRMLVEVLLRKHLLQRLHILRNTCKKP